MPTKPRRTTAQIVADELKKWNATLPDLIKEGVKLEMQKLQNPVLVVPAPTVVTPQIIVDTEPAKPSKNIVIIEKVLVKVLNPKIYNLPEYQKWFLKPNLVEYQVPVLNDLGDQVFDVIAEAFIDEFGKQKTTKIQIPLTKTIKEKQFLPLDNVLISIKNIEIKEDLIQDYFAQNPKIKHSNMEFDIFEFEGATMQSADQNKQQDVGKNGEILKTITKHTLIVFLK